jgi:hypothetical protein
MRAIVTVRGKSSEWCIQSHLSAEAIADMRADGLDIIVPQNMIPMWVAESGLVRPWCFLQDLWNLKNPFRK